jgi:pimeloyl-ACP methyl ester carboxylesterase
MKKHIVPLHVNGMNGRLLKMKAPAGKKRDIFLLYGHHASLERMFGLAETLNQHGSITMPDLPGFGGMDSFYAIGQKPTLDNYADYLASLIKLYYKRRRLTVVAMSFSVPLIIRTMQRYPEIARKIDLVVSLAGFAHRDDFKFDKKTYWFLRSTAKLFSYRPTAWIASNIILTKPVITAAYNMAGDRHSKMNDAVDKTERDKRIAFEVGLWRMNDVRTRTTTMIMMFTMDVCNHKVDVPAYHIPAEGDRYFDNEIVKQHLHVVFADLEVIPSGMMNHMPTIIATADEAAPYIPERLRTVLG